MAVRAKLRPREYRGQRSATKDDVDIGIRIRLRRAHINMSQETLGSALGVTFQQVQKYEKGQSRISGSRFLDICRALEVDPNYLLGWQGKPLNIDEAHTNDRASLKMAQAIGLLPPRLRALVHALIHKLSELSPADLTS
jgi:transcriptional regulator with XRE-family HTH domain